LPITNFANIIITVFGKHLMKPKYKKYEIAAIAVTLVFCLVLAVLLLFPVPDQLTYLQNMVIKNGRCTVSSGENDFDIQADTAAIENDMLIFKRSAATGEDSFVVISSRSGSILAKSVSIRFTTNPKDMLELSLQEAKGPQVSFSTMTFKIERQSRWRLWLSSIYEKIRKVIKKK
jgi:hypothetical protein